MKASRCRCGAPKCDAVVFCDDCVAKLPRLLRTRLAFAYLEACVSLDRPTPPPPPRGRPVAAGA